MKVRFLRWRVRSKRPKPDTFYGWDRHEPLMAGWLESKIHLKLVIQ